MVSSDVGSGRRERRLRCATWAHTLSRVSGRLAWAGCAALWLTTPACREEYSVVGFIAFDGGPAPAMTTDNANDSDMASGSVERDAAAASGETGPGRGGAGEPPPIAFTVDSGPREVYCAGAGPALRPAMVGLSGNEPMEMASRSSCAAAAMGRSLFRRALCTCQDVSLGGLLTVDAFDSSAGPYIEGKGGAAVGINGALRFGSAPVRVLGSLTIAGGGGLSISTPNLNVGGDLVVAGKLDARTANVQVARDLFVLGDITGGLEFTVGRRLYLPPGRDLGPGTRAAEIVRQPLSVSPPCPCGEPALDVSALVARAYDDNDNDVIGMSTGPLTLSLASQLTCGRFAVEALALVGNAVVSVAGRTALFVAGDLTIGGNVALAPESTGELDLFVAGNVILLGNALIGDPSRPAALRIYVGGTQVSSVIGLGGWSAQLYAPNAEVEFQGAGETFGAVFARQLSTGGDHRVHYDRAILNPAPSCEDAGDEPTSCDDFRQCAAGRVCLDGACGACMDDKDCAAPFRCRASLCEPWSATGAEY